MLAELLLSGKQPREALAAYESVLKIAPKRFNAVYGAARAASASGNSIVAEHYFRELLEISVGDERPELAEARETIRRSLKPWKDRGAGR
jgi:cytochrome c-type biogenesis protein CcmH/NrfG